MDLDSVKSELLERDKKLLRLRDTLEQLLQLRPLQRESGLADTIQLLSEAVPVSEEAIPGYFETLSPAVAPRYIRAFEHGHELLEDNLKKVNTIFYHPRR